MGTTVTLIGAALQQGEGGLPAPAEWLEVLTPGRLAGLALVLLATIAVTRLVRWLADRLAERFRRHRLRLKVADRLLRLALWLLAIYVAVAGVLQPEQGLLVGLLAGSAVALGLGAQDLIRDLLAGLTMTLERPFQEGDKIRAGGHYGEVVGVGPRSTRIRTPGDSRVTVPNSQVVHEPVANANTGELDCQVETELWISARADLDRARRIAYEAAATSRHVFLGKPVEVHAEYALHRGPVVRLTVRAYVLDHRDELRLRTEVTEQATRALAAEGLLPELREAGPDGPGAAPRPDGPGAGAWGGPGGGDG